MDEPALKSDPPRAAVAAPEQPDVADAAPTTHDRGKLLVRVLRFIVLYLVLRPIVLLPFAWQLAAGRALGRFGSRVARKPRWIAHCNLKACFPELTPGELADLERRHFESLGMSAVEMTFAWWGSEKRLRQRVEFVGLEHYDAVRAEGRSAILLTAHFTTMEMCGIALSLNIPDVHGVYRAYDRNPLADMIAREGRTRFARGLIERHNVMAMVRVLRDKHPLWFANDQLVRPDKRSAIVPFFGVPCLVHGALLDLVRLGNARVLPLLSLRSPAGHYRVELEAPLENFPSGDAKADLERVMKRFEEHIRRDPAQYMWVWRRFGRLPPEYPDIYRRTRDAAD
jgi:Kdo2-lipid IVA lauroyltransferase/acyltransferase